MSQVDTWLTALGPERETELAKIGRYHMYRFLYRINDAMHCRQLRWATRLALNHLGELGLDHSAVQVIAATHDDTEIFTGDVQAANKAVFNANERAETERSELIAIGRLIERFGDKIGPYRYDQLLLDYKYRLTREAWLVAYIDKVIAWCEAVHEIRAGNTSPAILQCDAFGRELAIPFVGYPKKTASMVGESSFLKQIVGQSDCPFLQLVPGIDYETIVRNGKPHTEQSIAVPSGLVIYDTWVGEILKNDPDPSWLWTPNTHQYENCRP